MTTFALAPLPFDYDIGQVIRDLAPPVARLAAVVDGMRGRGLVGAEGWLTAAGRRVEDLVEALTDALAARAYAALDDAQLDRRSTASNPSLSPYRCE